MNNISISIICILILSLIIILIFLKYNSYKNYIIKNTKKQEKKNSSYYIMPQLSAKTKLLKRNLLKLKSVDENKELLETLYIHYTKNLKHIMNTLKLKSETTDFPDAKLEQVRFIHKNLLNHIKSKMHIKKAITATYKSNTLK